jgi:hypothetical protein
MNKHVAVALIALIALTACGPPPTANVTAGNETQAKPYSAELERRIAAAQEAPNATSQRPDYLPAAMFSRLPPMPEDFYQVRQMVRTGMITDLAAVNDSYWQQPEWFPHFEDTAVPLLEHPPENRWGAYGIAVYPADSVSTINAGDSLDMYFYIKSGYLVETYQGINLAASYPASAQIASGAELPDGTRAVNQDPAVAQRHLSIKADPGQFVLEPNFPIYNVNGTRRVKVTVTADATAPAGNYVVALDTATVPQKIEQEWMKQYLNLYTSGGMTKIDRPYYQAFIHVNGGNLE